MSWSGTIQTMCYSTQIWAEYRQYVRHFDAHINIKEYVALFWQRLQDASLMLPRALEAAFENPGSDEERTIKEYIDRHRQEEAQRLEQLVFEQKTRQTGALRKLAVKYTKGADEDNRIATKKIGWAQDKLQDLHRTGLVDRDSRIYPGWYAPVLVVEDGRRVVKPMRFRCRPAGMPTSFDHRYPGTYNARRNKLAGFWKHQFGHTHGLVVVAGAFYEHVKRHRAEGRALAEGEAVEDVVLEFRPRPAQDMLAACVWSRWSAPGKPDLLSYALVTDDPPPEVAAAGHDRCIIPLRPENVEAWLNPDPGRLSDQYAVLDDRERPYYEHRLAA